ncbi:MAG: hypothetical protein ABGZ36_06465 [Actinomycetota bacterium]
MGVWVRAGLSEPLERLLAEQHENTVRNPFTPTEAASLYQELEAVLADVAAARQRATPVRCDPPRRRTRRIGGTAGDTTSGPRRPAAGRHGGARLDHAV